MIGNMNDKESRTVSRSLTLIYWRTERFWVGKLLEHSEIMSQEKTLKELEENIRDAYRLMSMDDVPPEHQMKAITL
jgi:hypothetical protein